MLCGKQLTLRINGKEAELLETIPDEFMAEWVERNKNLDCESVC